MKRVLIILGFLFCFFLGATLDIFPHNSTLTGVLIGGFIATFTTLIIEHNRTERNERYRRQDFAIELVQKVCKGLYEVIRLTKTPPTNDDEKDNLLLEIGVAKGMLIEERAVIAMVFVRKGDRIMESMISGLLTLKTEVERDRVIGTPSDPLSGAMRKIITARSDLIDLLNEYGQFNEYKDCE